MIVTMDECLYTHYNRKGQSTSSKFNEERLDDIIRVATTEYYVLTNMTQSLPVRTRSMHNAIYSSMFLEFLMVKGTTVSKSEQKKWLKKLKDSNAMFKLGLSGIKDAYGYNWKFGIKLHMFEWNMFGLLLTYQRLNDRRKGR